MTSSLRSSPADLGLASAVLDERKDDLDPFQETVGSSSGLLLDFSDALSRSADDFGSFESVPESVQHVLDDSPHVLESLRHGLEGILPCLSELRDDLEDSSHALEESLDDLEESSHRRSRSKSCRSGFAEVTERLLDRRHERAASVREPRQARDDFGQVL
jgi:hypothetical protein